MLKESVATLINEQINKEFYSAYLYLDMANYYHSMNLDGFANWFTIQAQEERDHAMLFLTYLGNNNMPIKLTAIAGVELEYVSFRTALEESLKHEQYVTASIEAIYEEALLQKDYRTQEMLNWFIKEQGEEEKNAEDNIGKFDLFGSDPKGLYALNAEMAARVYTAPSLVL